MSCLKSASSVTIDAGPDRPAEPEAGGEDLREGPGLQDDVRAERPQRRQRLAVEGQLAVGDVLEDQHAVAPAGVDQGVAARERERPPGRVLVLRDDVDEARAVARGEALGELVDEHPVLVHRDPGQRRLVALEGHDRAEVRRRLDGDAVTRVEQRAAEQVDALHAAAGDHQLVLGGRAALRRADARAQVLAHARQPFARPVLQRDARVVGEHARGDLGQDVGLEGRHVREPARHPQHAGRRPGEDRGQLGAPAVARAAREQLVPFHSATVCLRGERVHPRGRCHRSPARRRICTYRG